MAQSIRSQGAQRGFEYPASRITLITGAPGGGVDFAARLVAQELAHRLGLPVTVRNVPAATMAEAVAAAPADGSTLLMTGKILWLTPFLRENVAYDPLRDFAPVTIAARSPNVLIVNPKLPVASVQDLVALAKSAPGTLTFTSSGAGASTYLAAALLKVLAGIDIVHVARTGNVAAAAAVASGEVHFMFSGGASAQREIKAGTVRALAVGGANRSTLFPDLPTVAEYVPGYESESILALFAPAATPQPVIEYLNAHAVDSLSDPATQARLLENSLEAAGTPPEALVALMKSEMSRLGDIIRKCAVVP